MQPTAHPKCDTWRFVRERLLQPQGGANRVEWIVKRSVHAVAHHLHDGATIGFDGAPQYLVMTRQCQPHAFGILFPKEGAALDVREQNCYDASILARGHCRRADVRWNTIVAYRTPRVKSRAS